MGRRKTTVRVPPPPEDGMLVRAVRAIGAGRAWDDTSYRDIYGTIAGSILGMPAVGWESRPRPRSMREFDGVLVGTALRWIFRVQQRDLLSSVLLTEALNVLSEYACAIGDDRNHWFPSPQSKKELTESQGAYYIEFEVPKGAAFHYSYEEKAEYGPGFRGVAFVRRCHLSSAFNRTCNGYGIIPGFGRCRDIIGFDISCDLFRHAYFEGNRIARPEGTGPIRIGVEVPFGFVVGSRKCDHWGDHIEPLVPKLSLDDMVELIEKASRGNEKAEAPAGG